MGYVTNRTELNCFRIVKKTLDELYSQLPGSDEERVGNIQNRLELLREEYKHLKFGMVPSYDNDLFKIYAYTYCYVAAHANIVYHLLNHESSQQLANAFVGREMKLSCIGGGPGSDLLGVLKFMQRTNKRGVLRFDIYDREENWTIPLATWRKLLPDVYHQFVSSVRFAALDVFDRKTWERYPKLLDADLFTVSYILSEIYFRRKGANTFFRYLFEKAKPGAFFLFIDNVLVPTHDWFDGLVREHNRYRTQGRIRIIHTSNSYPAQQYSFCIDSNECKEDLSPHYGRYYDKFGQIACPKLKSDIVFRICRKEGER